MKIDKSLGDDPEEALLRAGVWLDVPKPPKFEDIDEIVVSGWDADRGTPFMQLFPIGEWTQAYNSYRYKVRIFAFSEYVDKTTEAAKKAMKKVIKIDSDSFYQEIKRTRELLL